MNQSPGGQDDPKREHFVPLHTTDVVEFLALHPNLPQEDVPRFREIASLILSLLHHMYRQRHERLTYVYSTLDPDRDRLVRTVPTLAERQRLADQLIERTQDTLLRANYHRLSQSDIQSAINAASQWGVRMRVNFEMLDRLEVYARGYVIGERRFRDWRRLFKSETASVPLYQRIVVVFQTSPDLISDQFDSRFVYLRMFKNVPQQDVDMMLPGTGIQMTWLDHSKIVVPSLYAAGMTLWRFLRNVVLLTFFGVFKTIALVVLVILAIGFGIKSMFTYRTNTKRRYMLSMTQSLYYQNLDNNAGVLLRLLDEGEQQEACEAILAYFVTAIQSPQGTPRSLHQIDSDCEKILQETTGQDIDFDVEQAAQSLAELGVLQASDSGWTAKPPAEALEHLTRVWDDKFNQNLPTT